jgi:hypothetical protein
MKRIIKIYNILGTGSISIIRFGGRISYSLGPVRAPSNRSD